MDWGQSARNERIRPDLNVLKVLDGFGVTLQLDETRSDGGLGGLAQHAVRDLDLIVDLLLQSTNGMEGSLSNSVGEDDKALVYIAVAAVTFVEKIRRIPTPNQLGKLAVKFFVVSVDQLSPVVG